ncbi:hypothetical protein HWV62_27421 [Athelia sp. TMB]|nr:hypothetical protein HWV62_41232 [Athelia sp. TMB]KAF7969381.1 hypothetical protein HWV62_27421 [Athelia sp. TMB]
MKLRLLRYASAKEVDDLMHLAEEKLIELCQHEDLLDTYGVRLNILGKTALLPSFVQAAVAKAEGITRHNKRAILNICMPYTSSHEITSAVESTVQDALEAGPNFEINEDAIEARLMTSKVGSPPLDILIRTSGVKRLSDYMLWQVCTALLMSPSWN